MKAMAENDFGAVLVDRNASSCSYFGQFYDAKQAIVSIV